MSDLRKDEQELIRKESEIGEAITCRAPAPLERYLAEDFSAIIVTGREMNKQQVLASVTSADYEIVSLRNADIRVRIFGDCAVAIARGVVNGRYKGREVSGQFRYTRVWIRAPGPLAGRRRAIDSAVVRARPSADGERA